jgi:NADPH:quinone reductase-like Zn-dependent oxidoreductase
MRAIPFYKAGDADSLRVEEWPNPEPRDNEILIQVKAFGLNFADIVARKGNTTMLRKFPFVPGYEVSGVLFQLARV